MPASSLQTALNAVRNAVTDLTTVEVRTYTGSARAIIDQVTADGNRSFDDLLTALPVDQADISLAYLSKLDLDGDAVFFRADGAPADLAEPHRAAVEAGIASRAAIINLFKDIVDWAVGD